MPPSPLRGGGIFICTTHHIKLACANLVHHYKKSLILILCLSVRLEFAQAAGPLRCVIAILARTAHQVNPNGHVYLFPDNNIGAYHEDVYRRLMSFSARHSLNAWDPFAENQRKNPFFTLRYLQTHDHIKLEAGEFSDSSLQVVESWMTHNTALNNRAQQFLSDIVYSTDPRILAESQSSAAIFSYLKKHRSKIGRFPSYIESLELLLNVEWIASKDNAKENFTRILRSYISQEVFAHFEAIPIEDLRTITHSPELQKRVFQLILVAAEFHFEVSIEKPRKVPEHTDGRRWINFLFGSAQDYFPERFNSDNRYHEVLEGLGFFWSSLAELPIFQGMADKINKPQTAIHPELNVIDALAAFEELQREIGPKAAEEMLEAARKVVTLTEELGEPTFENILLSMRVLFESGHILIDPR